MSNSETIVRALDHYLEAETDTDYAFLLQGPWGVGKTHFIKNYIKTRAAGKPAEVPLLYVSLHGITDISQVVDQIVFQLYPATDHAGVRFASFILRPALPAIAGPFSNVITKVTRQVSEIAAKVRKKALIFDDLERCSIPVADMLGFINDFVEHDQLKVVVIANEEQIPSDPKHPYKERREKVFGKTLRFNADTDAVLATLISNIRDEDTRAHVEASHGELQAVLEASGKPNFRILRRVFSDYEHLLTTCDPRLNESSSASQKLLLVMTALGLEFYSGKLDEEKLRQFNPLQAAMMRAAARGRQQEDSPPEPEGSTLCIRDRYTNVAWDNLTVSADALATLFSSGVVETSQINAQLGDDPAVVGDTEAPGWRRLWDWSRRSRADYEADRKVLLGELSECRYSHPGEIMHAYGVMLELELYGESLLGSISISDHCKRYLKTLLEQDKLDRAWTFLYEWPVFEAYNGLGYQGAEHPDFESVKVAVKAALLRARGQYLKVFVTEQVLPALQTGELPVQVLYEDEPNKDRFGRQPFLHHIPVKQFAAALVHDNQIDLGVLAALRERYSRDYPSELQLTPEHAWIKDLRRHLLDSADNFLPPHRRHAKDNVSKIFADIIGGLPQSEGSSSDL